VGGVVAAEYSKRMYTWLCHCRSLL